jgi:hypothetical protein
MPTNEEIEAYLVERRAVLLNEDIEVMRAHLVKWGNAKAATASVEVLRVAWHKARTGVTDIPRAERERSFAWLRERGYEAFSDPDN